jgi:DNA recombination protein Rad52
MQPKPTQNLFGTVPYTQVELDYLQKQLDQKLEMDEVAKRQGPGGSDVHYIETWRVIQIANTVLGFNGWSSNIVEISQDYLEAPAPGRFSCGFSAIVRVSLKDGSYHEDIGYGTSDNQKSKGAAIANGKKNAVSDALKRALKNFGNQLGLTIYDREHINVLKKNSRFGATVLPKQRVSNPIYGNSPNPGVNGHVKTEDTENDIVEPVRVTPLVKNVDTPIVNGTLKEIKEIPINVSPLVGNTTPLIPVGVVKKDHVVIPGNGVPLIPVGVKRENPQPNITDPKKKKI